MRAKQNETCKAVECQKGMQVFIPLSCCNVNYFFNWLVYNFHKKTVCQYSRQFHKKTVCQYSSQSFSVVTERYQVI